MFSDAAQADLVAALTEIGSVSKDKEKEKDKKGGPGGDSNDNKKSKKRDWDPGSGGYGGEGGGSKPKTVSAAKEGITVNGGNTAKKSVKKRGHSGQDIYHVDPAAVFSGGEVILLSLLVI